MSAVASLSWVASLPCAFSMRYSAGVYPASVKASFRYGASKSTHRVDDVVSGRTTPTCRLLAPLVAAWPSALSWSIVAPMLTVKELMLSPAGTDAEELDDPVADALAELDELDELDELQAAAVSARAAARPATPSTRKRRNVLPPREREPRPPVTSVTHSHPPYPFAECIE